MGRGCGAAMARSHYIINIATGDGFPVQLGNGEGVWGGDGDALFSVVLNILENPHLGPHVSSITRGGGVGGGARKKCLPEKMPPKINGKMPPNYLVTRL